MVERLEAEEGLVLRPWREGEVGAMLAAFAPADMVGQASSPVTTAEAAPAWIAATAPSPLLRGSFPRSAFSSMPLRRAEGSWRCTHRPRTP